jgi:hypothetical protein
MSNGARALGSGMRRGPAGRRMLGGTVLIASLLVGSLPEGAQTSEPPKPIDGSDRGRVYLAQSLTALHWARRYAESARRRSAAPHFDLPRYLAELDAIIQGLERYLQPSGPPPEAAMPVEITGHFLLEGLRGAAQSSGLGRPPEP